MQQLNKLLLPELQSDKLACLLIQISKPVYVEITGRSSVPSLGSSINDVTKMGFFLGGEEGKESIIGKKHILSEIVLACFSNFGYFLALFDDVWLLLAEPK